MVGNRRSYKMKAGKTFTNAVTATKGSSFSLKNSMLGEPKSVRKEGWPSGGGLRHLEVNAKSIASSAINNALKTVRARLKTGFEPALPQNPK
jgi:hypothetical protein